MSDEVRSKENCAVVCIDSLTDRLGCRKTGKNEVEDDKNNIGGGKRRKGKS